MLFRSQATEASSITRWLTGSLLITALLFTAYFIWKKEHEKNEAYVERDRPKIEISTPIQLCDPKDAGGKAKLRTWKLRIINISSMVIRNCYVKQKSLINVRKLPSRNDDMHFKVSTDKPLRLNDFDYQQSFDLNPNTDRLVDIAAMPELDDNPRIYMLYAIPGQRAEVHNSIPPILFPHTLTLQVSGENLTNPVEATYILSIDGLGRLQMAPLSGH